MNHISVLKRINELAPYPQCYSLDQATNRDKARGVLHELSKSGYVRLHDYARCGFEMVKGEYATLTEIGIEAIKYLPSGET